jgi:hypothetical protein
MLTIDRHTESLKCIHISNKRFKSLLDNIDEVNLLEGFKADMTDIVPTAHIEHNTPASLDGLINYFFQNIGLNAGLNIRTFLTLKVKMIAFISRSNTILELSGLEYLVLDLFT